MSDIVLSKKQQKKALRSKKANKQTVKNVLAAPEQSFWPLLKEDDVATIQKALETNLPRVRQEKVTVKYKEIANLSKADRKVYRASLTKNNDETDSEKKNVVFGVNYIDRLVCANEVSLVLISADVSPRSIVEGLLHDCVVKKVPVLVVVDLRRILRQFCGVSSVVFGIKKNAEKESKISELETLIKDLSKAYSPKYIASIDVSSTQTMLEENTENVEELRDVAEIYLYRKSRTERVFPEAEPWTPYWEHIKEAWAQRDNPNLLFMFYEDMSKDSKSGIVKIANFLDKHLTTEDLDKLDEHLNIKNFRNNPSVNNVAMREMGIIRDNGVGFIGEGKTGKWRDDMSFEVSRDIDDWIAENMKNTDIKFPS